MAAHCTMTPDDLRAWQAHMGLTQAAAADALGVSLATYKRWLTGDDVPRLTALACAAVAAGLGEWSAKSAKKKA